MRGNISKMKIKKIPWPASTIAVAGLTEEYNG